MFGIGTVQRSRLPDVQNATLHDLYKKYYIKSFDKSQAISKEAVTAVSFSSISVSS